MEFLQLKTTSRQELIDITSKLKSSVSASGVQSGLLDLFVPHTTAGVIVNENVDPSVRQDILADLDRLVPGSQPYYRHAEGNSAAHLKASIMGSSIRILIEEGRLMLGTWQGIYFAEFDGPRNRKVFYRISSA
ncbi:MAG: secondary thiamine-phosphate synthase enzyme YjbQ [Anaerolineales bacterium]|jgi:secondary thiamine-phosphate synthase enzyme